MTSPEQLKPDDQSSTGSGKADGPATDLTVLAWPAESGNPYVADLYQRLQALDATVTIEPFEVLSSWRTKPDVIHVHWPGSASNSPSAAKATAKTALVLATLRLLKQRGAKLVWTAHNLKSHDIPHPRLERFNRKIFDGLVDGVIHLTDDSKTVFASRSSLAGKPATVVPHGHYTSSTTTSSNASSDELPSKQQARSELGLDPDIPVIGFVGQIRAYKNVPELIKAYRSMTQPCQLVVGGRSNTEEMKAEVAAAAAEIGPNHSHAVRIDDQWLSDSELALRIQAADVIVLAYEEVHNSGVAILAVGMERPIVINPQGSMARFADTVGQDWVYPLADRISGRHLDEIIQWAQRPRATGPDLSDFDPDIAAAKTLAFLAEIAGAG